MLAGKDEEAGAKMRVRRRREILKRLAKKVSAQVED
jgi:hypothetical protein